MKSKLAKIIPAILSGLLGSTILLTVPVSADSICDNSNVPAEVKAASGCPSSGTAGQLPDTIVNILNVIIGITSLIAVIFIVIGGVQYITSSGDPGKTKKARDTILYACIGLAVCALAFAITNFAVRIINESNSSSATSESNP